ncbi:MAG: TIGR02281 family clan AA aspartic protease [Sphingomonadaceae bacterium]
MRNALLIAFGAIVTVGWLASPQKPVAEASSKDALITASKQAAEAEKQRKLDNYFAGTAELTRSPDGHFYSDVAVNRRTIHALVDTGASVVALTGADASAIGLRWNPADVRVIGSGASGPVEGVPVMLDTVELGRHEARQVQAVIIPQGLDVSLLGQSYLSTIDPVRIEGDRMLLGG